MLTLGHVRAVDPPLRLEHWLDNVSGARADAEAHLVVGLNIHKEVR